MAALVERYLQIESSTMDGVRTEEMKIPKLYMPITRDALATILQFLPELGKLRSDEVFMTAPGSKLISENPPAFAMHEYHPLVGRFQQALYEYGFVQEYDWPKFDQRAKELCDHPEQLQRVTLRTCVKLLTFHARKNRTWEGRFASMIETGHMTAILERLAALSAGMNKKQSATKPEVTA